MRQLWQKFVKNWWKAGHTRPVREAEQLIFSRPWSDRHMTRRRSPHRRGLGNDLGAVRGACPFGPASLHQRRLSRNIQASPSGNRPGEHQSHSWRRARSASSQALEEGRNGPAVHLPHARSHQDLSGQPEGIGERQSVVLSRCQDRRARPQRVRQEHALTDHGGHRYRVQRRGLGGRRRPGRLPAPGAAAR